VKTEILQLEAIFNDTSFRLPVNRQVCNRRYTPLLSQQQWWIFRND